MPEFFLNTLPKDQQQLWSAFQKDAGFLVSHDYYLAGGTALVLQLGHRSSYDFDFFSRCKDLGEATENWLEGFKDFLLRNSDENTVHAEVAGVNVTFIGGYKYDTVEPKLQIGKIPVAGIVDIALMKLLALTHRSTLRDYLDLAAIFRYGVRLKTILDAGQKKYGPQYNKMIAIRALSTFSDVDQEMPGRLNKTLQSSWQEIIRRAIKDTL